MCLSDLLKCRLLHVHNVFRRYIPFRSPRRAERHVSDREYALLLKIVNQLSLSEARMYLGFTGSRRYGQLPENRLQLLYCHIRNPDIPDKALSDQCFKLAVRVQEFFSRKRSRIGIPRIAVTSRSVVIRERPVYEQHVKVAAAQVFDALSAGCSDITVHVIPHLAHYEEFLSLHGPFFE